MKWVVYNLLFAAVYPLLLPGFLIRMAKRGGYAARFADRFALYPAGLFKSQVARGHDPFELPFSKDDPVWVHAVSVGEVQVAGQLMREWRQAEPGVRFCFSTTSSTGWKMAEREVTANDTLVYNPLDFPNFVKSALKTVHPRAIVLTESEIWPNFIRQAKKYRIPLFLINARVSDRSAPRYRLAKCFFGEIFRCFDRIFAQSELDRSRLMAAGAPAERTSVTGSFKFDVAHRKEAKEAELREWIGRTLPKLPDGSERPLLLGGSTWPGEDEALLRIYRRLVERDGDRAPALVIAPRHFEKADAIEANVRAAGFECVRRSRDLAGDGGAPAAFARPPVYLCDTTGEMMGLFGICSVAFVGKSLCAHGSQNMIEPCLCGKPTFVGPHTENFRPVMSDLLEARAIVQVKDEAELAAAILRQFSSAADATLGERAAAAVLRRQGVVPKCVRAIREAIG